MSSSANQRTPSIAPPAASPSPSSETGWLGIELRHLAAFEAVVESGSFNQAARRLGYTQSAVSQQIRALERIVGHRLFNRQFGASTVSLTPAGERAAGYIREMIATLGAAEADLAAFTMGKTGTLTIGTFQSVSARMLPAIAHEFSVNWPDIEIRLCEVLSERGLFGEVEQGVIDVTFGTGPIPAGPFAGIELLRDDYVLLLPADWSVELAEPPTCEQISRLPLLGCYCDSFASVEAHLRAGGGEPRVVFRSDDNATLHELVAAGVGAALMPRLAYHRPQPAIRLIELDENVPARTIVLAWKSQRMLSAAASALIDVAKQVCARAEIARGPGTDGAHVPRRSVR
jgi:DNA-binding transcriptional LysR family regulator